MPTEGWKIAFCLDLPLKKTSTPILDGEVSIDQHGDRLDPAKSQKLSSRPWANWPKHKQTELVGHPFKILNSKRDVGVENCVLLRPSTKKSSTPILDGVENSSSDIQKCGFCLNLLAEPDFPPRHMDAY